MPTEIKPNHRWAGRRRGRENGKKKRSIEYVRAVGFLMPISPHKLNTRDDWKDSIEAQAMMR